MRLSKKSEYALRALLELTLAYGQSLVRRSDIAERQHIPLGFLESILLQLKHAGVLASRPGVDGGFRLIKKPEQISLGSIIRALDGPLAPIPCVSQTAYQTCEDCPYAQALQCPIKIPMLDVRNAIAGVLDHYTLKDFAQQMPGVSTVSKKLKKQVPVTR
ncbi:MAG: Rrf2 family transcriptional regulator [Nitrospirae bacterium]|nr:Rrf2 family transcriptional regulator [Nitrospirota bacterium]MDA1303017.1 Rrf2 family transcriptional regulator [Nitrospirota bacterium]